MRRWLVLTIVTLWATASPAEVAPFHDARLVLRFGPFYGLSAPAMADPGLSGSLVVGRGPGGTLTRIEVPAALFAASEQVTFTSPGPYRPANGVDITFSNGAGTFVSGTGTSMEFGGTMPLNGIHKVCLFFACGDPNATVETVPLNVIGMGGVAASSPVGLLRVAIAGRPWSTASVTVDEPADATQMVRGGLTPTSGGGTFVQLVTPLQLSTNAVDPKTDQNVVTRGLAILSFVVVPEPGETGLLAVATATLVWLGLRRARLRRTGQTS
jgi:hypothetical protein